MFDLSLAETSVILVAALLLIGPEELPAVIKGVRKFTQKSKDMLKEFSNSVMELEDVGGLKKEVEKLNSDIKKIVDMEGNLQETYDISDIMPEIEKARTKNNTQVEVPETIKKEASERIA